MLTPNSRWMAGSQLYYPHEWINNPWMTEKRGRGWGLAEEVGQPGARCWRCFGSNIPPLFLPTSWLPHVNSPLRRLGSLLWRSPLAKAGQPAKRRRKPLQLEARKPFPPVGYLPRLFCHSRKRHACVLPSFSRAPVSRMFNSLCLPLIFVTFSQILIVFFLFYLNFYPFHQLLFFFLKVLFILLIWFIVYVI